MDEVKNRNGVNEDYIPGKRTHEVTDEDLKRVIKD